MPNVYGMHAVLALLDSQPQSVETIWILQAADEQRLTQLRARAAQRDVPVEGASKKRLAALCNSPNHQGVVARTRAFAYADLATLAPSTSRPAPLVLVLDQVVDPHNVGSLIRSAYAFGAVGLILCRDNACSVTPAVMKVAAGAAADLPIVQVVNLARTLESLQQMGFWITGTEMTADRPIDAIDLRGPTALVLGSEARGLRPQIRNKCDYLACIPMVGPLDSLNVAVSGAIALFAASSQRREVAPRAVKGAT